MLNPQPSAVKALACLIGARAARRLSAHDLAALRSATVAELVAEYGLSERAAEKARAVCELAEALHGAPLKRGSAFRSSADIFRHFRAMRDLRTEEFRVLLLDGKHRVLRDVLVSKGTLTSSPVHPRETFRTAIKEGAAAIVCVHNHPSGDPSPSADDLDITRRLIEVGDLIGIRVLDHVIIGDGRYTSLADRGLMAR